jgi:ROK family
VTVDNDVNLAAEGERSRGVAQGVRDLVFLSVGTGLGGDLLLAPIRALLAERCPFPPRVEVSSLGDAAVLTGALAFGLRSALDNVFTRRNHAARA